MDNSWLTSFRLRMPPPVPGNSNGNANSPVPSPASSPAPPAPTPKNQPAPAKDSSPNTPPTGKAADGRAAQKLNADFSSLTPNSPCQGKRKFLNSITNPTDCSLRFYIDGQVGCVQKAFAQCLRGKFVITPCGNGSICAALPLVNKSGTDVTCTTESDAVSRIQATGATGGLTG
jgi:hypothetical protein